ncbi:zf-HC2 domain-containing protein [Nocardia australiensis]|uniref:zf-HC2 domain-containing protein n=1 Tax=Nocardia australiensis TaxID=2887191 RepID=UPI001D141F6B|nr:zf-HC2 domain-containing protein [Nocardia australiensis]
MTDVDDDYATWDAPYVLGSLTRTERREYEDHLAGCPACQAAVADLTGLPGLLGLVDTDAALTMITVPESPVTQAHPPLPELLPQLADTARRQRTRSRWVSVGAAVAAAAAAVAIAIPVIGSMHTSTETTTSAEVFAERTMQPLEPTPVTADVKLIRADDRTRVVMTCSYGPTKQAYTWTYQLVVQRTDGQQALLGQWPAGPGTELTIDRTVDAAPDQIHSVEIRSVTTGKTILVGTI